MLEINQTDNGKNGEFIAYLDGDQAGLMTYYWDGKEKFVINHTEVDPAYNGKGIGKELVYKAVAFARENNLKIIPICPFAKATFARNEDIRDVVFS